MITPQTLKAMRAALEAFIAVLEEDPLKQREIPTSGRVTAPVRAVVKSTPKNTVVHVPGRKPLPASTSPARKPSELSEATRKDNLKAATEIVIPILKMLGPDNPMLVSGVKGQLALQRIACDDQLVSQAIDAAKKLV